MNWKHIEAMMLGTGRFHRCTVGDDTIITNEHAMLVHRGEFAIKELPNFEPVQKIWARASSGTAKSVQIGGLFQDKGSYIRAIGPEYIDEAYFRCFDSDKTEWKLEGWVGKSGHPAILAFVDGVIIAGVMPMRKGDNLIHVSDVPDAFVFSRFSSGSNGYYLETAERIAEQIQDCEGEIDAREEQIETLEYETSEYRREMDALKRRARDLVFERNAVQTAGNENAKSDAVPDPTEAKE